MRIIIDAMGGDNSPNAMIKASVRAVDELGVDILLVGKEEDIKKELSACGKYDKAKISIQHAEQIVTNDDSPAMAIKSKTQSSLVVGLKLLKEGNGDGFVSAGSTGGLLAGSLFINKRIKGVDRPALAPVLPTKSGIGLIIDGGSNVDCKPINLLQFGVMGSIYMKTAFGIPNPRVGLANVGTEEKKGNELTKQAHALLKNVDNINFVGNVEGRDFPEGKVDVIVCDGFVGNIMLKSIEGMGSTINSLLKEALKKNVITILGALIASSAFKTLKKNMDYKEHGGAILLGVDGTIIKAHGSSDEKSFFNTIRQTKNIIESGLMEQLKEEIGRIKYDKIVD